jgi:S-adenosylmethionine-diacylgycerolhomoserine-N-methlytransferase
MRRRAERRLEHQALAGVVDLDPRPYGSHSDYSAGVEAILFSYSLSMIPPFQAAIERAAADLRPGGRLCVVDFLDAWGPVGLGLRVSHVALGSARLDLLRRSFPRHSLDVRRAAAWNYFLFVAER